MSDAASTRLPGDARPSLRELVAQRIERPLFQRAILAVIVVNAIVLGLETSKTAMAEAGWLLVLLDRTALAIFVVEIALKLFAYRWRFFRSGWNVFDFLIVAVSLAPASEGFAVLRALRILRVLRLVSLVPSLRRVVEGLLSALPGMGSVLGLMSLIFYVAAVMATKLFGATHPDWFGDIGNSAYSLFQIMTLESWSMGIVRPLMETHPWAWVFFVPFILVTTFAVVNLVVGLVVNAMQDAHHEEGTARTDAYRDEVLKRLAAIEVQLAEATARAGPPARREDPALPASGSTATCTPTS